MTTDNLGLDQIGDLSSLLNGEDSKSTKPNEIDLNMIDEDPKQPRTKDNPGFSKASIAELAETIKSRGIKTPISLRETDGRYVINHGARRFRASKVAGKTTIPAFVDNDYNEADQVIENLQRNELTAREIADYIGRELSKGRKKGEIASEIGKSNSFVSQHVALLDLPEPIAEAFNTNRVNDVTVVSELIKAHKSMPQEVEQWLSDKDQEITRSSVKLLREYIDQKGDSDSACQNERDPNTLDAFSGKSDGEEEDPSENPSNGAKKEKEASDGVAKDKGEKADSGVLVESEGGSGKLPVNKKTPPPKIMVSYKGNVERPAMLMLDKQAKKDGCAMLKYDDTGKEFSADFKDIVIMSLENI